MSIKLPDIVQKARIDLSDFLKSADKADRTLSRLDDNIQSTTKNVDKLGSESADAGDSIDDLGSSASRTTKKVKKLGDDSNETSKMLRKIRNESRETNRALGIMGREFAAVRGEVKQFVSNRKEGLSSLGSILGNLLGQLKVPAIAGGIGLLISALGSATAGAVALVGAITPVLGLGATLPIALGALISVKQVFNAEFIKNMGAAASAVAEFGASSQQAEEALKKLPPGVREAAKALGTLEKSYKAAQKAGQEAAGPGLARAFTHLAKIMPNINRLFKVVGATVGDMADKLAQVFSVGKGKNQTATILANIGKVVQKLSPAVVNLATAFRNVVFAASPIAVKIAGDIAKLTGPIAKASGQTGRLVKFFELAYDVGKNFAKGLGNIAQILYRVGRIGTAVFGGARGISASFTTLTDKMLAFTKSEKGVAAITKVFEDAKPVLHEVGLLLRDILKGIVVLGANKDIASLIAQVRTQLLPAVLSLANGVGSELGPAIISAITAFVKFQNALSFSPLLKLVGTVADLTNAFLDLVAQVPGLSTLVATLLTLVIAMRGLAAIGKFTGITSLVGSLSKIGPAGSAGASGLAGFVQGMRGAEKGARSFANVLGAKVGGGGGGTGLVGRLNLLPARFRTAGAEAEKAGTKMGKAGKALGIVGAVAAVAGAAIGDNLSPKTFQNVNQVTNALNDLAATGTTLQDLKWLGPGFQDFGSQLHDLTDPSIGQRAEDLTASLGKLVGIGNGTSIGRGEFLNQLQTIDQVLANMVSSGQADKAARIFEILSNKVVEAGGSVDDLKANLPGYEDALAGASGATGDLSKKTETLDETLNRLKGTVASADDATANLEQAYDEASAAIAENGKTVDKHRTKLDLTTEAGRNNQKALEGIRDAALDGVQAWVKNGDSADVVAGKIKKARDQFVAAAIKMGLTKDAAEKLATAYGLIPKQVATSITANAAPAVAAASSVKRKWQEVTAYIASHPAKYNAYLGAKDGGLIGSIRGYASGDVVSGPGGPRSDSILARLSNGEFVVNAEATKKNLDLLRLINSGREVAGRQLADMMKNTPRAGAAASSYGGRPIIQNINNDYRRTYNININETRGPSTERSLTDRLRSIETLGV